MKNQHTANSKQEAIKELMQNTSLSELSNNMREFISDALVLGIDYSNQELIEIFIQLIDHAAKINDTDVCQTIPHLLMVFNATPTNYTMCQITAGAIEGLKFDEVILKRHVQKHNYAQQINEPINVSDDHFYEIVISNCIEKLFISKSIDGKYQALKRTGDLAALSDTSDTIELTDYISFLSENKNKIVKTISFLKCINLYSNLINLMPKQEQAQNPWIVSSGKATDKFLHYKYVKYILKMSVLIPVVTPLLLPIYFLRKEIIKEFRKEFKINLDKPFLAHYFNMRSYYPHRQFFSSQFQSKIQKNLNEIISSPVFLFLKKQGHIVNPQIEPVLEKNKLEQFITASVTANYKNKTQKI